MKIGICDDNKVYLKYLYDFTRQLLSDQADITFYSITPNKFTDFVEMQSFDFDILITDIDLGTANSISLVQALNHINPNCLVIFISNYLEFALEVYDVNHVYFMLKSEVENRLPKAIDRAICMVRERTSSYINIHYQHKLYRIALSDIIYIEALGRYVYIHTVHQKYTCIRPLKEITKELNDSFCRSHNSYIVHFDYVKTFTQSDCTMTDDTMIPISRTYSRSFLHAYKQYIMKHM